MTPQTPTRPKVLIVGAGPVGLLLALRLATAKIPITIIEASPEIGQGSKAIVYQPSIYPELQRAGVLDALKDAGAMKDMPVFRRTADGSVIVALPNPVGGPRVLLLPQYRFIEILEGRVRGMEGVEVLRGCKVVGLNDDGGDDEKKEGGVSVTVENACGEKSVFRADYLIGADGGRSFIRKASGISFSGETLSSQLVATDVRYPFDDFGFSDTQFMVDPVAYGLISKIDDTGLWRVSFNIPDDATDGDIESQLPSRFEAMFPGPRPLKYKIENVAPYKCQQLCAATMRKGRILLVGDAAHLTNPYAGLGLTTGFFDASSLADVLISIIHRGASDALLDSWSQARLNVYHKIVDPMSRAAFYRVQDPNPHTLVDRDPMLKAAKAGKMMTPPSLASDVLKLDGYVV